jgi:predicted nucleic-acid-binding protein
VRLLDTNVLLRLLLGDDQRQAEVVEKLLQRGFLEKKKFFVADLAMAEIVWILEKQQSLTAKVVSQILRSMLDDERIHFENRERLLSALALHEYHRVDFIDAYQAALVQEKKLESVVSYDQDFARLPVRWDNPEKG